MSFVSNKTYLENSSFGIIIVFVNRPRKSADLKWEVTHHFAMNKRESKERSGIIQQKWLAERATAIPELIRLSDRLKTDLFDTDQMNRRERKRYTTNYFSLSHEICFVANDETAHQDDSFVMLSSSFLFLDLYVSLFLSLDHYLLIDMCDPSSNDCLLCPGIFLFRHPFSIKFQAYFTPMELPFVVNKKTRQ